MSEMKRLLETIDELKATVIELKDRLSVLEQRLPAQPLCPPAFVPPTYVPCCLLHPPYYQPYITYKVTC